MTRPASYGDSAVIARRADRLREHAADLQALADRLVARIEALGWAGRAADAMRERVAARAAHLRSVASRHETAADALDAHGRAVTAVKEEINRIEVRARSAIADAQARVANAAAAEAEGTGSAADPDDERLAAVVPPPRGHRDWLDVELPGR
ncbi:WXG100 family type VII secretion target [Nocardioides sambongensis]|uniref:WXG100 family type VII secretion target n=1 Tax=Nocardioides sambongensis TaxID=2589074 RepID=UPI00112EA72B|nr:hypothetical protein [Nocardioides sambongensis]